MDSFTPVLPEHCWGNHAKKLWFLPKTEYNWKGKRKKETLLATLDLFSCQKTAWPKTDTEFVTMRFSVKTYIYVKKNVLKNKTKSSQLLLHAAAATANVPVRLNQLATAERRLKTAEKQLKSAVKADISWHWSNISTVQGCISILPPSSRSNNDLLYIILL